MVSYSETTWQILVQIKFTQNNLQWIQQQQQLIDQEQMHPHQDQTLRAMLED